MHLYLPRQTNMPDVQQWSWAAFADQGRTLLAVAESHRSRLLVHFRLENGEFRPLQPVPCPRVFQARLLNLPEQRMLIEGLSSGWQLLAVESGRILWDSASVSGKPVLVCLCEQGRWMAYRGDSGGGVIDVRSGKEIYSWVGEGAQQIAISSGLGLLAIVHDPHRVALYHVPSGDKAAEFESYDFLCYSLSFNVRLREVALSGARPGGGGVMIPRTRIARLDSGEIYWQIESGSVRFSPDGTRAIAETELLGCPRWRSLGKLGSGPANIRYTKAGIVTTRPREFALWDEFGELRAALDWTLTTETELSVTPGALALGSPKHEGLLLCQQQGEGWVTFEQRYYQGYPLLCQDHRWLVVYGKSLQVEPFERLSLYAYTGPTPTRVPGTISMGPAPDPQDTTPSSPQGFWCSCQSFDSPLELCQDGRASKGWTTGSWQQSAPGQPVLIEWRDSPYHPIETLELREPYLLNEKRQPRYERVKLPGPPASDPLGLVGTWEHYQFHPDGTYSVLNPDNNTSYRAGIWGVDGQGDYFVLASGMKSIPVSLLEPQVLQLDREVVCSKPTLRALPGVWTLSGASDLPDQIVFSRQRDRVTGKSVWFDAQTLQILGEYPTTGHDSHGLLVQEMGDPVPIQMRGFDEFVLHHGSVVGRRNPGPLPDQSGIPSPARKAAWEEKERKQRIEDAHWEKISERNFRIY